MEPLHLWTSRHVGSSSVGSKCSRSAGDPLAVGQPVDPDRKTLKNTRKRKVGGKVGEGSFWRGKWRKSWSKWAVESGCRSFGLLVCLSLGDEAGVT